MRTEPLAAINSVALAIGRFSTLEEMLDHALLKVLEVVRTDAGSVYLFDEAAGELVLVVAHGLSPAARLDFQCMKLGEGITGRVAEQGVPIVVRNLKDDPRLTKMAVRSEGFRGFASMPLRSNFKTYGTLNVLSRSDREFNEEEVQLLNAIAAQLGLAVANARLYLSLQASERKFRGLVENAQDLIYLTDPRGHLTYINPAARMLLGLEPEVVCDGTHTVLELVHPDDRAGVAAALERMLRGEIIHGLEFRMPVREGGCRWFSQTNVPIRDERGGITGMQAIARDTTQARDMQEQIARTERLADLGRMAASIAHEIRNPLSAIVNSITVLRRPGAAADPLRQIVTEEAERLDKIIREFLVFARPPARTVVRTDLATLVDDTILLFQRDEKISPDLAFHVTQDPAIPPVLIDPNQIRQVLWNLLKNAAEAMSGPGCIQVETQLAHHRVVISIADQGPGIADPAAAFEPFYTTKTNGTGMGLAVVARIVREHGGTVLVGNVPGRGARVAVHLPIVPGGERANGAVA